MKDKNKTKKQLIEELVQAGEKIERTYYARKMEAIRQLAGGPMTSTNC
jgi:hypothetical protein